MSELRKVPDGIPGTLCRSFSLVQDDETVGFEQFREFCGSLAEDLSAAGKLSWVFMAAKMEHAGVELRAASRFISCDQFGRCCSALRSLFFGLFVRMYWEACIDNAKKDFGQTCVDRLPDAASLPF